MPIVSGHNMADQGEAEGPIVTISLEEQNERLYRASLHCNIRMLTDPVTLNGTFCERVWDSISCWPDTPPGSTATQYCPNYFNGFNTSSKATKRCLDDGTWYVRPDSNKTWTNYTSCAVPQTNNHVVDFPELVAAHMWRIRLTYNIGYGISLVSLIMAVFLMLYFKRLHCPRNVIHINLFLSFILRSTMTFMRENLLVQGLGFKSDIVHLQNDKIDFSVEGSHWECRLFFTMFNYILGTNYMWIFVEGLYLHLLLTVAVFSEKSGLRWYIIYGWCSPILFVVPWVIVRVVLENELCWNTHPTAAYFWIMKGPVAASLLINFIFFINIIRLLFTKLNAANSQEAQKYRKLAKSTLVLIPLFGIHYIVFLGLPDRMDDDGKFELVRLYFEMFFNSFQGFFVAILFCFLNGEVQSEILKKWNRYKLRRTHGSGRTPTYWNTFSSYVMRPRGSVQSLKSNRDKRGSVSSQANGSCIPDEPPEDRPWRRTFNSSISNSKTTNSQAFNSIPEHEETHPMVTEDITSARTFCADSEREYLNFNAGSISSSTNKDEDELDIAIHTEMIPFMDQTETTDVG